MNKRNFFSLVALASVAVLSIAGIMQAHHDDCHTRITGRRKLHCRREDRRERRSGEGRKTKTKTTVKKEAGRPARYKRTVESDG